ncbi:dTDP-4-dehydrorhamnose 3,5-epimerase [Flavobacterium sp. WLB]|uniref:dTDP-4-dehydrorhamnose 3,5-epimerase n=1 Tax=unclassified Flavobacterium TaxID=196869 RepID=UPI0006AB95E6|nr:MULTISPECIES: dTDP-4-dehydrorhamnose 3,5-epimerase [unclassified Flavobacterium]KOP39500.1 dTDP-4-dehydrorhamnose 3,5-epimerase [Flavobacterium sp. VMW]OWU91784.1 dTDP-4-dehydrorhamnose 3,5-epimerase [Flavobacterium sp. NLM]PUU67961.1 dTDP-4-dehydrorhamnose 3,5-epimerase [Flavobacterium sp. WLB]
MKITQTFLEDLVIIEPVIFGDERGYFFESYNKIKFKNLGIDIDFVQDNQSFSKYGTLRGLHYQNPPFAQTKLVRVLEGEIIDVAVDLRKDSTSYGKVFSILLSAENKKQLLIPKGFAHGFSVISETASVMYKCDQFYDKESEGGIKFNDSSLNIDWGMDLKDAIISEKDQKLPFIESCNSLF